MASKGEPEVVVCVLPVLKCGIINNLTAKSIWEKEIEAQVSISLCSGMYCSLSGNNLSILFLLYRTIHR
jgi:hypothetical protein